MKLVASLLPVGVKPAYLCGGKRLIKTTLPVMVKVRDETREVVEAKKNEHLVQNILLVLLFLQKNCYFCRIITNLIK